MARRLTRRAGREAVLAAIARREWLLQMLALGAAGCRRGSRPAQASHSAVTILYGGDEVVFGPRDSPQFLVFLPLVTRNAKGEFEGRLAERWEHSPDYHSWTIHLRKGIRWEDGVPFTAHDIKFTLDLMSKVFDYLAGPSSVTVLDDTTYTMTYQKRGYGTPFDNWTVYYPKHLLEELDPKKFYQWDFWLHPVGNGPYRYVRHTPRTMMELEANPDDPGKPKIERVVLKFFQGGRGTLTELLSGNVDAITLIDRADLLKLAADGRFNVYDSMDPHVTGIFWNQRHPLFRHPEIRRALTLAINRREMHQVLNLPEHTPLFDVIPTRRQLEGAEEIPEPLPYDPEQAKQLLGRAGWTDSGNGLRDRDGNSLRFTAAVWPGWGLGNDAVYIQAQLRRVGVQMEIQTLEESAMNDRFLAGEFEAAIYRLILDNLKLGPLGIFGRSSPIGYSNPRVTALLEKAWATMDPEEHDRDYRDIGPIFQADLPVTFLYPHVSTTVASRRIRGLSSRHRIDPIWYADQLWLEDGR